MSHYFYITPEEYAEASFNGIDARLLNVRVRYLGWKKEKAMTAPVRERKNRKEWAKVAADNGIKYSTFISRISKCGMSEEEAATKPLQDKALHVKKMRAVREKIPKEWVRLAETNGIKRRTLYMRIKSGWSFEEAATRKIMTPSEAGKKGASVLKERYGRFNDWLFMPKQAN